MRSVQDGITLGKANMCSSPSLRRFPSVGFRNSSNAGLADSGPFSSVLGKIIKCFSSFASFWKNSITGETEDLFSFNHILCMTEGPFEKIHAAKASSPSAAPKLRASLSGTFLQTLPELVLPLKGHSVFISAQPSTNTLQKVGVPIRLWKQHSVQART